MINVVPKQNPWETWLLILSLFFLASLWCNGVAIQLDFCHSSWPRGVIYFGRWEKDVRLFFLAGGCPSPIITGNRTSKTRDNRSHVLSVWLSHSYRKIWFLVMKVTKTLDVNIPGTSMCDLSLREKWSKSEINIERWDTRLNEDGSENKTAYKHNEKGGRGIRDSDRGLSEA